MIFPSSSNVTEILDKIFLLGGAANPNVYNIIEQTLYYTMVVTF